jgi:hypothetical protein
MPSKIESPQFLQLEKDLDKKIGDWKEKDKNVYAMDKKRYGGRYLDNKEVSISTSTHRRKLESTPVNRMRCRPFRKPSCTGLLLKRQREDICTSTSTLAWGLMSSSR